MESVSSFGKDDDPDFVPTPITRNKRTESWFQGGINRIVSRGVASAPDPEALRDGKSIRTMICQSAHVSLEPRASRKSRNSSVRA